MRNRRPRSPTEKGQELVAPRYSHLTYFVLAQIAGGVRKAKALRAALGQEDVSHEEQTFFAFMGRMLNARPLPLITRKRVKATGGARGQETEYSLTAAGRAELKFARDFYRRLERRAGG